MNYPFTKKMSLGRFLSLSLVLALVVAALSGCSLLPSSGTEAPTEPETTVTTEPETEAPTAAPTVAPTQAPTTAARDSKWLEEQGYRVEKVQPVDLFPRTKHCEVVSCYTKTM